MLDQLQGVKKAFDDFTQEVFKNEVLSEREKSMVALAICISQEDREGVKKAILTCKQTMMSNEEIGAIFSIAMAMKGQKIAGLFKDQEKKNTVQRCC